jgi:anti-sigma factor RsiW
MTWLVDDRKERLLRRHIEDRLTPAERRELEELTGEDPGLEEEARVLEEQARLLGRAPDVEAPPDLAAGIMQEVLGAKPPSRIYAFLFKPRTVRVRMMTGLSAAAAIAAGIVLLVWGGILPGASGRAVGEKARHAEVQEETLPAVAPAEPEPPGGLELSIEAGAASRVTLVGDFNGWSEEGLELRDEDGDGVWTIEIDASPGRYRYRFLVDGETWLMDPAADAHVDDGFGGTDSVRYIL